MPPKKMSELEKLAREARTATRAVVQIHAEGHSDENVRSILDPRYVEPQEWMGSGFFIRIGQDRGYILTNAHVVRNANRLQIMTLHTSEEMFTVEIVGLVKDMDPDIALLKLPAEEQERFKEVYGGEIPFLELGDSSIVTRGTNVKAIGYPLGMAEPNVSGGELSNFVSGDENSSERLVTDAAINPGNSGGPSLIEDGKVIGINTAIIVNANNIGFITPINYAKILIDCFLQGTDDVNLCELDGSFQKNSLLNAKLLKQEKMMGVIVTEVDKGGMLDAAGIKKHDILYGINEFRFDRHGIVTDISGARSMRKRTLFDVIRSCPPGEEVTLYYVRQGEKNSVAVKAQMPKAQGVSGKPIIDERRFMYFFGMVLQELSIEILSAFSQVDMEIYLDLIKREKSEKPLVAISFVSQGSLCDDVALDIGDVIEKINGQKVYTLEDVKKCVEKAQDNGEEYITFETDYGRIGHFPLNELVSEHLKIHAVDEDIE